MEILTQLTNINIAQQIDRYSWKTHLAGIHKILIKNLEWKTKPGFVLESGTYYKQGKITVVIAINHKCVLHSYRGISTSWVYEYYNPSYYGFDV